MEQAYLPGKIRDRIRDLMKERKITQETLATKIGMTEISLSRFISGKTDKLGDEYIIRTFGLRGFSMFQRTFCLVRWMFLIG